MLTSTTKQENFFCVVITGLVDHFYAERLLKGNVDTNVLGTDFKSKIFLAYLQKLSL